MKNVMFVMCLMVVGCSSSMRPANNVAGGVHDLKCDTTVECYDRAEVLCPEGWDLHESKLEVLQEKQSVEYVVSCLRYPDPTSYPQ